MYRTNMFLKKIVSVSSAAAFPENSKGPLLSVYYFRLCEVAAQVTQALSSYLMFIYMASNERGIL